MKTYYVVLSKPHPDELYVETIRTDKKAALQDVELFKEIVRRHTWIQEVQK